MRDGTAGRPAQSKETSNDNEQRERDEIAAPQRATAVPPAACAALDEQHADDISTYALHRVHRWPGAGAGAPHALDGGTARYRWVRWRGISLLWRAVVPVAR